MSTVVDYSSREFRPLNDEEIHMIRKYAEKQMISQDDLLVCLGYFRVSYEYMQGGFCVCILKLSFHNPELGMSTKLWRGASRRSYKDPRKPIKGEMLAFSRAILYSRPVEI